LSGSKKEQPETAQVNHPFDESATLLSNYLNRVADIANDNSEPLPSIFRRTASDTPSPPAKTTNRTTSAMASYIAAGFLLLLVAAAVLIYVIPTMSESNTVSPAATASADPGAIVIAPPHSRSADGETLQSQEDEKPESLARQLAVPAAEAEQWSDTVDNLKQVLSEREPPPSAAETFKRFLQQHRTSQAAGASPHSNDPLAGQFETNVENTRR
jgi:hypothetical protein